MSMTHVLWGAVAVLVMVSPATAQVSVAFDANGFWGQIEFLEPGKNHGSQFGDWSYPDPRMSGYNMAAGVPIEMKVMYGGSAGFFTIMEDGAGGYMIDKATSSANFDGTWTGTQLIVTLQTAPVYFDISGYDSAWRLPNYFWQSGKESSMSVILPREFSQLNIRTPGSDNYFSRNGEGQIQVTSDKGISFDTGHDGTTDFLKFAAESLITLSVARDTPDYGWFACGFGNGDGYGRNFQHKNFAAVTGAQDVRLVAGDYVMMDLLVEEGLCKFVDNSQYFTVPADATDWSHLVTFVGLVDDAAKGVVKDQVYTLKLTGPVGVPEPATMTLLALGGLAMLRRRHTA